MMLFTVVVFIILFVLVMVYFLRSRLDKDNKTAIGMHRNNPLVLVKDTDPVDLKKWVVSFCKTYGSQHYQPVLRITAIAENRMVISFPKKIEFELLCYFICFLQNKAGVGLNPNVAGWTRTSKTDPWITPLSMNKTVMLFPLSDEAEANAIYLTTADNIGYKLNLVPGGTEILLDNPANAYLVPPVEMSDLTGRPFEDIA